MPDVDLELELQRERLCRIAFLECLTSNFKQAFPAYDGSLDPQNMIQLLAATAMEQRREIEHARRAVAERCLLIAMETLSTPDGWRFRFPEETGHAIMREFLGWGGM